MVYSLPMHDESMSWMSYTEPTSECNFYIFLKEKNSATKVQKLVSFISRLPSVPIEDKLDSPSIHKQPTQSANFYQI